MCGPTVSLSDGNYSHNLIPDRTSKLLFIVPFFVRCSYPVSSYPSKACQTPQIMVIELSFHASKWQSTIDEHVTSEQHKSWRAILKCVCSELSDALGRAAQTLLVLSKYMVEPFCSQEQQTAREPAEERCPAELLREPEEICGLVAKVKHWENKEDVRPL